MSVTTNIRHSKVILQGRNALSMFYLTTCKANMALSIVTKKLENLEKLSMAVI